MVANISFFWGHPKPWGIGKCLHKSPYMHSVNVDICKISASIIIKAETHINSIIFKPPPLISYRN